MQVFLSVNKRSDLLLHHKDTVITASESMVVIYDQSWKILNILKGHQDTVNAISLMDDIIVSGSQDKSIRIWWDTPHVINMDDAVVALNAFKDDYQSWITVACANGSLTIFKVDNEKIEQFQILDYKNKFILAVKMGKLPGSDLPFIITGGSDKNLCFYLLNQDSDQYLKVAELKGHGDWIKSIDLMINYGGKSQKDIIDEGDLMVASSSQDGFIRLWRISRHVETGKDRILNTKSHFIIVKNQTYSITFHSLLTGHEDWVNSVRWHPLVEDKDGPYQPLSLVSASADKSIIIWCFDEESRSWYNKARLGDVGGNTLGYYGALICSGGEKLLAHGYHGALQCWDLIDGNWISVLGTTGHELAVQDICWNPTGTFLLSTSVDQTTRLYAEWNRSGLKTWHELARTQIHGYDLQVLAFTKDFEYVSGADEKILRIFEANRNFVDSLEGITQTSVIFNKENLPIGASQPALGLSNKALYSNDLDKGADEKFSSVPGVCRDVQFTPPLEADLLQNTLWPEKEKLYGHGFEIMAVGTSMDGMYIASSCKASKAEYAALILWSAESFKKIGELPGHSLTVTTIVFSPDCNWLVSAGRDRSWVLHHRTNDKNEPFRFYHSNPKAHARVIWKCSWTIDSKYFATASRDKSLKIWSPNNPNSPFFEHLFDESVTSCDFAPYNFQNDEYIIAVGLESGNISVLYLSWCETGLFLKSKKDLPFDITPSKTVKAIKWRPRQNIEQFLELAACSADHSVRIFTIAN